MTTSHNKEKVAEVASEVVEAVTVVRDANTTTMNPTLTEVMTSNTATEDHLKTEEVTTMTTKVEDHNTTEMITDHSEVAEVAKTLVERAEVLMVVIEKDHNTVEIEKDNSIDL